MKVQKKAYDEIQSVIGKRAITNDDQPDLPYVNAVVKEVGSIALKCTLDCTCSGDEAIPCSPAHGPIFYQLELCRPRLLDT